MQDNTYVNGREDKKRIDQKHDPGYGKMLKLYTTKRKVLLSVCLLFLKILRTFFKLNVLLFDHSFKSKRRTTYDGLHYAINK